MDIEVKKTETIYQGRVFDFRSDLVKWPNGVVSPIDVIVHGGAVVIVPFDEDGNLWMIRQYRYAVGKELYEFPAGTLEKGEEISVCASRELREEIGMDGKSFRKIGEFYLAPGYSTELLHIFLAADLYEAPLDGDEDELISVQKIDLALFERMAAEGEIQDAKTLAAFYLARPFLDKRSRRVDHS